MDADDLEARVKNIDERTKKIEQILPTLATKEDLKVFATTEDLKVFATKEDLKAFATKEDLKAHPTREEMHEAIKAEGKLTRARFDAVAERIEQTVKGIAEGHEGTKAHVNTQLIEVRKALSSHDRRIMKLEADSMKRRR